MRFEGTTAVTTKPIPRRAQQSSEGLKGPTSAACASLRPAMNYFTRNVVIMLTISSEKHIVHYGPGILQFT
jgi:hypothetical protein